MSKWGVSSAHSSSNTRQIGIQGLRNDINLLAILNTVRNSLCSVLDHQNIWEDLAEKMNYNKKDIEVRREQN